MTTTDKREQNKTRPQPDYNGALYSLIEEWAKQKSTYNAKRNSSFNSEPFQNNTNTDAKIKQANEYIIKNVNHWFLVNVISPEITKNEKKKRSHKTILLMFVVLFLIIQFGFLGYLIQWIFSNLFEFHKNGIGFSSAEIKIFFAFISGYITSIIIELIAMLNYIVKNVFDTSVSGLANAFKESSVNSNLKIKEQQE